MLTPEVFTKTPEAFRPSLGVAVPLPRIINSMKSSLFCNGKRFDNILHRAALSGTDLALYYHTVTALIEHLFFHQGGVSGGTFLQDDCDFAC
jgi:hypothetical protein